MIKKDAHARIDKILFAINEINDLANTLTLKPNDIDMKFDCTDCRNQNKRFPVTCNQCYKIANFLQ